MSENPAPARGRAALLEKLRQRQAQKVGQVAPIEEPVSVEPPKIFGRAALLKKIQESRQKAVGSEPEQIREVTKKIEDVSIEAKEPVTYKGSSGKVVPLSANYIRVRVDEDRGMFLHEVRFEPLVESKSARFKLLAQHSDSIGPVRMFDGGSMLYLPRRLDDSTFECQTANGEKTNMSIIFRGRNDSRCLHLYNVLFKRIMRVLMLTQMGRNYFDTKNKHIITQHRLEVYPGYAISVDELEGGLLLCLDTTHRVLRTQNAYDLLTDIRAVGSQNLKEAYRNAVIGQVVLTRYNNRTYRVDDVSWESSPLDKFETSDGGSISFKEYYLKQYNIEITNDTQPLLVHRKTFKGSDRDEQLVCLVPELSYLTGLSDQMRADFKVMKDVGQYTRVTPAQRAHALKIYLNNVRNSAEATKILADWGLRLEADSVKLDGRVLDSETVYFGKGKEFRVGPNADWTRAAGEYEAALPVDINNWIMFHTSRDQANASKFASLSVRLSHAMGCDVARPRLICLPDDRNESYIAAIRDHVRAGVQVAVFVCPTLRADRYQIIKRLCCTQFAVASQVVLSRTLNNEQRLRAIAQKIMAQINCKLGGTLWTVRMPFTGWMIVGIDVYHSAKGSGNDSVCGIVASLNESVSRWYSLAVPQKGELSEFFKVLFSKILEAWKNVNGHMPSKIVIFRDGVGDGQLDQCLRYEVAQFESTLEQFGLDIPLCFVVVQKRISTRLYALRDDGPVNPTAGTVLDHTVTRRNLSDFFLVPQSARQGTVNPTHYIVLRDTCNFKPDHVQRLAFKLCHLYYNWSGTIRVPAPCQYAHKLAAMYGQQINKPVAPQLADKLYYL